MVTTSIISVVGIISLVIGGHFSGGDHFDGGDHFGGGTGPLPRRGPSTFTSWKIIYCIQFLSYAMCSSVLFLKLFIYSN